MAEEKKITEEVKEEIKEETKEEVKKEVKADAAEDAVLSSTENKRKKKAERRDAKAARKAANLVEEKKTRPNNALIAVLIFGVVIGMFAFVGGYNYFSKPASIEKYIKDNGGKDTYGAMAIDGYTTANITAKGNDMTIAMTVDAGGSEDVEKELTDYYKGDDGEDMAKYITAYFLTTMKPEVRGFTASADTTVTMGDDELQKVSMTYKEAKDYIKEQQEKAKEDADEAKASDDAEDADADADAAEEAEDEAKDTKDKAED